MKNLLMLTVAFTVLGGSAAMAGHHGDGHKGKMFEKHDLNGDGVISKSEFLEAHEKRFDEMDADGNGEISKDEAKAGKEKMREKMKERQEKRKERREDRAPDE